MFENLDFWKTWPEKQKYSLFFFLFLLTASLFYLFISYYSGGSFVIDWETQTTSNPIRIAYDKYYSGLYEFTIFADNFFITKSLQPGPLEFNTLYSYVFLAVFFGSVLFLYAIATTLSRFYFVIASVFLAGILLAFRFENLMLFGLYGKEPYALILALFFIPGYYLHAFKEGLKISYRYIIFLCIGAVLFLLFMFFSQVEHPFMHLASYQIISPLIISVIFVLMLGFEVVKGFLRIITQTGAGEGKNNFFHFSILTIIYLGVLLLIFLYNENVISWKIIFVDAVWILLAGVLFGFWGFKDSENNYSFLFKFQPLGAYVYLTLAIICTSSFAYFFVTANDPYVEVLEQTVIISQLSFGLIFFIYIIANFFPAMMEGHAVYKVLYQPKFMPYFSAKLASFVGLAALFFVIKMAPYYQAFAGYYISLAQFFKYQQSTLLAEEYFKLANIYGKQTHIGNYALANIAEEKGNSVDKQNYLAKAININPTEYAFARLADIYSKSNQFFDEVFTLKNGVNEFPESGPLNNNLGLALSKINITDTAIFYLEKSRRKNISESCANANILGVFVKNQVTIDKDSLSNLILEEGDIGVLNNLAVIANSQKWHLILNEPLNFMPGITIDNLILNYNLLFQNPELADSVNWKKYKHFQEISSFNTFSDQLNYAFALAFIKTGHNIAGFRLLEPMTYTDDYGYSKYDILLAQLYMRMEAPYLAAQHFEKTQRFYGSDILVQYALALMETGNGKLARQVLTGYAVSGEPIPDIVNDMLILLEVETIDEILNRDDQFKYNFLKYRGEELSTDQHEGIILSMEDEGYQAAAYIDYADRLLEQNDLNRLKSVIQKLNSAEILSQHLKIQYLKILAVYCSEIENYQGFLNFLELAENEKENLGAYYYLVYAKKLEADGAYDRAEQIYDELGSYDAFCEECILQSAEFFSGMKVDKTKAYNILLGALEVNPYAYELNKAYAKASVEIGLESYAEDVLAVMSEVLSPEKYGELEEFIEKTISENKMEW